MNIHAWALGLSCFHIYTMGTTPQQQLPLQAPAPSQPASVAHAPLSGPQGAVAPQ